MREDQQQFLSLRHLPARLDVDQVAWLLNCKAHDVPVLVTARLLKPLGNPPPNAVKYFSTAEVLEASKDRNWLARMSSSINAYWRDKNLRKRGRSAEAPQNGLLTDSAAALN